MGKEPEKGGGLSPKLLVVPAIALCCFAPIFVVWAIGSGFFAWLAGVNPALAVAMAFAVGGAVVFSVQSRRKAGLHQDRHHALRATSRRAARRDAER